MQPSGASMPVSVRGLRLWLATHGALASDLGLLRRFEASQSSDVYTKRVRLAAIRSQWRIQGDLFTTTDLRSTS